MRSTFGDDAPPGFLRGLADARLAPALRRMHGDVARSWTVAKLAKAAALSRSAFFERFTSTMDRTPMAYLLAWRMAVAKDLLRREDLGIAEVAERVATARRARSVPRSPATWVSRRAASPARARDRGAAFAVPKRGWRSGATSSTLTGRRRGDAVFGDAQDRHKMEAGEPPDQRIIEQMGQLIGESIKAGVCLDGAGLHRSARRARLNRAGGAERGPYAGGTREDHFGLATSVSENDAIGAGYTHLQSEGFVYFSSQPGMREFFSYWHSGREDRFTTMSREVEAHIDGYARVRREGWSVPVQ